MAEVNFPAASESPWLNPDNGVTYEFVGGAWRAISTATDLSDTYVNVSGDTMTGELILYRNPIQNLGATPKQYVDNKIINSVGNGALSIASFGSGDISTGSYTANQSGAGRVTLPQISYGDLKDKPSIPNPGNGTITITQPGTNPQTFTVNQNNNTTIALRNDNTQVTPGNGALTIKTAGQGASASGTFTANQSTATTLTLPTIRYQDLSGTPTIPPAAGDGTITIKQPGSADQSFTVNQSGNTEINLKNDNTVPTVGNGIITIKQPGTNDQTFTVNQTGNTVINLKNDNTVQAVGNGRITIKQPGTTDQTFTVNQSGNTEINLKNDNTVVTPGNGSLTIKTAGEGASATGTFTANQSSGSTLTLPTIRYGDLSGRPSIPAAPGNGTITIRQPGRLDQSFTANQANDTLITLSGEGTEPGDGQLTIKTFGDAASATGVFTANQAFGSTLTLPQIRYADLLGTPSIPAVGNGTITIKQPGSADQSFTVNQSGNTEINLKNDNTVPTVGNGIITIKQPGTTDQTFTVNQTGNTVINLKNDNTVVTPGNGTITITQPGVANQTFTVNQAGNTTIALRNDDTVVTPGNGSLTIRTSGQNAAATGSFTANQSGNSTLTLPAIRWTDISGKPTTEEGLWTPEFLNDNLIFYNGQFGFYKFQGDGGVNLTGRIRWNNGGSNTNEIKIQTPFVIPSGVTACNGTGSWLEATTGLNTAFVPTMFQDESTICFIRGNIVDRNLNNNRLKHNEFGSGDLRFSIFLINANPI